MTNTISNILLIAIFFSIIAVSNSLEDSGSTAIELTFKDGLIKYNDTILKGERTVLCCNISNFKGHKMVFTLSSSGNVDISSCYQASSNQMEDYQTIEIEWSRFPINDDYYNLKNIIAEINNTQEYPFLYISISNSKYEVNNFTLFIRENESYRTEFKTEEILNPAAYLAYNLDISEFYEKTKNEEFLLSSTKGKITLYMYLKGKQTFSYKSYQMKYLPINQHSLSSFYRY